MKQEHSATPWILNIWTTGRISIESFSKNAKPQHPIAEVHQMHNNEQKANAEFIVRACNSHDALLEACKTAVVQGCVLLISLAYVAVNTLTDLVYAWIDPRIRLGEG